ncbi:PQQ-dependent sugar dehydrogenase [Virgibacillus sp. MG-45]|uniref:PQQ-dependent sugar dehydrogenase n=1 Tax=Virgibacillus sp. MG-45 TaxID=3102791 RepID=UPI002EDAAED9
MFQRIQLLFMMVIVLLLSACANEEDMDPTDEKEELVARTKEDVSIPKVIAENLQEPWEIAFVGERIFVSERTGNIVEIREDKVQRKPVRLNKNLSNQPEAGLLGIVFPKDFENVAFAYYSYQRDGTYFQRVITIEETEKEWAESEILLDHIPGGQFHQGGRLKIGPDEKLYVTTGDATNPTLSQDLDSLAGKILRMNVDGTIPDDNPFSNSYVYSYGHRNPQGLAWDSNGRLFASEHGANAHDEINQIKAGANYGWPIIQGSEEKDGMISPVTHSGEETWAPSGMDFFYDSFYFASLRGEGVRKYDPETERVNLVISEVGRIRDVDITEAGIYVITNNTDGRGVPSDMDDRLLFFEWNPES